MTALLRIILAGAWKPIAWLFGGLILRWQIRRGVKQETALEAAEQIAKKHDRMNHATLGTGATDADRIERLRRMADALDK